MENAFFDISFCRRGCFRCFVFVYHIPLLFIGECFSCVSNPNWYYYQQRITGLKVTSTVESLPNISCRTQTSVQHCRLRLSRAFLTRCVFTLTEQPSLVLVTASSGPQLLYWRTVSVNKKITVNKMLFVHKRVQVMDSVRIYESSKSLSKWANNWEILWDKLPRS